MKSTKGISLIEIIVAIGILGFVFVSLGKLSSRAISGLQSDMLAQKATYLAQEGMEITRLLRDQSWSTNIAPLTLGTNYYFVRSSNWWAVTATSQPLIENIFSRTATPFEVQRNSSDDIVPSGGTPDPNTKRVVVRVLWGTREVKLETYLTNFKSN